MTTNVVTFGTKGVWELGVSVRGCHYRDFMYLYFEPREEVKIKYIALISRAGVCEAAGRCPIDRRESPLDHTLQ